MRRILGILMACCALYACGDDDDGGGVEAQYLSQLEAAGRGDFFVGDRAAFLYVRNLCQSVDDLAGGDVERYRQLVEAENPADWTRVDSVASNYCDTELAQWEP